MKRNGCTYYQKYQDIEPLLNLEYFCKISQDYYGTQNLRYIPISQQKAIYRSCHKRPNIAQVPIYDARLNITGKKESYRFSSYSTNPRRSIISAVRPHIYRGGCPDLFRA